MMPKFRIDWKCDYVGDWGYAILFQEEYPDEYEVEQMAIQHFKPWGEVTELDEDNDEDNESD